MEAGSSGWRTSRLRRSVSAALPMLKGGSRREDDAHHGGCNRGMSRKISWLKFLKFPSCQIYWWRPVKFFYWQKKKKIDFFELLLLTMFDHTKNESSCQIEPYSSNRLLLKSSFLMIEITILHYPVRRSDMTGCNTYYVIPILFYVVLNSLGTNYTIFLLKSCQKFKICLNFQFLSIFLKFRFTSDLQ